MPRSTTTSNSQRYWRKARRCQDYDSIVNRTTWSASLKDKDMSYPELLMQYQGTPYVMLDNIELSFL